MSSSETPPEWSAPGSFASEPVHDVEDSNAGGGSEIRGRHSGEAQPRAEASGSARAPSYGTQAYGPQPYAPQPYGPQQNSIQQFATQPYPPQAYGAPGYAPPPYGPAGQQYSPAAPAYGPQPYGADAYAFYPPPPLAPSRRRRRRIFVAGAVVLALLVAGGAVGGYQFLHRAPTLNYQGKKINQPMAALKLAESHVFDLTQHQVVNRGAGDKCYFAVPATGSSTQRSNVSAGIYCGPMAFLDSAANSTLLHYSVEANPVGSHVDLVVSDNPESTSTGPFPSGLQLIRPDSSRRYTKLAAVSAPSAPAGPADAFLSEAKISQGHDRLTNPGFVDRPSMYGTNGGVTLDSLLTINYYGTGADARSAAPGQVLIAFQVGYRGNDTISKLDLGVSIDGGTARSIPQLDETADYKVLSVPTSAKSVELVLTSAGTTQTLSLLDGKRGAHNIQVLNRLNYYQNLDTSRTLTMGLSQDGDSTDSVMKLTVKTAYLDYFVKMNNGKYASPNDPTKAFLHINLTYTVDVDPGQTYDVLPSPLLELRDSAGHIIQSKNFSTDGGTFYAFLVPATFTTGTLMFGDAGKTFDDGLTENIGPRFQLPVSFEAG